MTQVLITASTTMELSLLLQESSATPVAGMGHVPVYRGSCGELCIAVTGMGKVNAACAATLLLERLKPELVINTGCGGAFPESGLSVGDLAFATSETFADEGVETPSGWGGLDLIGIPVLERGGERIFNTFELAKDLAQDAFNRGRGLGFAGALGPFLTVSTCSGTYARGCELLRRYPGICENMEGAAMAQVAQIYGVPLLEVRGISNMVEDRDLSRWNLKLAVSRVQRFLLEYLV